MAYESFDWFQPSDTKPVQDPAMTMVDADVLGRALQREVGVDAALSRVVDTVTKFNFVDQNALHALGMMMEGKVWLEDENPGIKRQNYQN